MTKAIRIENADTSHFKVLVQVWDKGQNGAPDTLAQEIKLPYAAAMTDGLYLTSTRYVVVKEYEDTP